MIEIEKKYKVSEKEFNSLKKIICNFTGKLFHPVEFETNILYSGLTRAHEVLRFRYVKNGNNYVTYKSPISNIDGIRKQTEIESCIGSDNTEADNLAEIFNRLGYHPSLSYEKKRQELYYNECTICFDKLPFGYFIELEGSEEIILTLEKHLRLKDKVETRSYPTMTEMYGELNGGIIETKFE